MKYLTVPWLQKTQGRGGGLVSDQARSVVLVVAVLILTIVMGRGIGQGVVWPWILGTFLAWVLIWGHPLVLLSALFVTLSVFPRFNNIGPFSSLRIDELLVLPFFALTSVVPRVSQAVSAVARYLCLCNWDCCVGAVTAAREFNGLLKRYVRVSPKDNALNYIICLGLRSVFARTTPKTLGSPLVCRLCYGYCSSRDLTTNGRWLC